MTVLSPYSVARRMKCPGSRVLEEKYPREESQASREGIAAHWVASQRLYNAGDFRYKKPDNNISVGTITPNGEVVTDEMLVGAELYASHVVSKMTDPSTILTAAVAIEKKINISSIHPNVWGTPDCWYLSPTSGLHIWEYKFGFTHVEVFENWQMIEYAAGILQSLNINGLSDQHLKVSFHVVQPQSFHRDGNIRTWETRADKLRAYFNILENAENMAMEPDAPVSINSLCDTCTARHVCGTLQKHTMEIIDAAAENIPFELSPTALGFELRNLQRAEKLLKARISGLSQQALSLIRSGKSVAFFELSAGTGRMQWSKSANEIIELGELLGFNFKKPDDTVTPRQAIDSGVPEDLVKQYSQIMQGEKKLTPVNQTDIKKIFQNAIDESVNNE